MTPPASLATAARSRRRARCSIRRMAAFVRRRTSWWRISDYVEVMTEIDIQTPIPSAVKEARTDRGFLFLGCRFHDQMLRTYARQIMKRSRGPHFAVAETSALTRNERKFYDDQMIEIIDLPLAEAADARSSAERSHAFSSSNAASCSRPDRPSAGNASFGRPRACASGPVEVGRRHAVGHCPGSRHVAVEPTRPTGETSHPNVFIDEIDLARTWHDP